MKIGLFSHYYRPEIGAPSSRLGDFAGEWSQEHEVHVCTCFPNHPQGVLYPGYQSARYLREAESARLMIHRCWTYVTPNRGFIKKTLGHLSFWFSCGASVLPRLPRLDCAIGSSPTFFAAMAARSAARAHGCPFIMEVRDLWPAVFVDLGVIRNRFIIGLLERWEMSLYHSADRIITVTEAFRANLRARGIPERKIVNIPNGADVDYWRVDPDGARRWRERLGLAGKFVVLYIGAHGISQGLKSVVQAAGQVATELPECVFLFVGEGADKPKLVAEAERIQAPNIKFLDAVGREDVRALYAAADVCLVPLRDIPLFDAFIPSKMFEMLAAERPVLGCVRGEAAAILTRSGGALVVPPEQPAALADGVRQMHRMSPMQRAAMGAQGRRFVSQHYSRQTLAKRYAEVLAEVQQERVKGGEA